MTITYLIGLDNIHFEENISIYKISLSGIRQIFWRPLGSTVFNKKIGYVEETVGGRWSM